jgi:mannose-6-phosphate isomerase-like protein (cupin superfamily)
MTDYEHHPLDDFETNPDKPGRRWELSPQLGIGDYNVNVAMLERGEALSENGYHYHENQREFFYLVDGRCQVEVEDDAFRLREDEVVLFEEGVVHLLHNPFDEPAKLVAIGSPPEGRYPVEQVEPAETLLQERYGSATPSPVDETTES